MSKKTPPPKKPPGLWKTDRPMWADSVLKANKDLEWVQRLYQKNTPSVQIPGQPGTSTHFMQSSDSRVYPTVVNKNNKLQYLPDARHYADSTNTAIHFPNDEQAQWFGENYKSAPGVLKFELGGKPKPKPSRTIGSYDRLYLNDKKQKGGTMNSLQSKKERLRKGVDATLYPLSFKQGGVMNTPAQRRGLLAKGVDATLYPLTFQHGGKPPGGPKKLPPINILERMDSALHTMPGMSGVGNALMTGAKDVGNIVSHGMFSGDPLETIQTAGRQLQQGISNTIPSLFPGSQMSKGLPPVEPWNKPTPPVPGALPQKNNGGLMSGAVPSPKGNNYIPMWGPAGPLQEQFFQNEAIQRALEKAERRAPLVGQSGLKIGEKTLGNASFGDKTVLPNVGLPKAKTKLMFSQGGQPPVKKMTSPPTKTDSTFTRRTGYLVEVPGSRRPLNQVQKDSLLNKWGQDVASEWDSIVKRVQSKKR